MSNCKIKYVFSGQCYLGNLINIIEKLNEFSNFELVNLDKQKIMLLEFQDGFNNACFNGKLEVVKILVNFSLQNIFFKIKINSSPSYIFADVCKNGHTDLVEYLLSLKDNFNFNISANNDRAFRFCSENGHIKILKLLLQNDTLKTINISAQDEYAFKWAVHNQHFEVVKFLLELKPDININSENDWAFRFCCHLYNKYNHNDQHLKIAKYLLEINQNINIHANNNEAYIYAKKWNHQEVINFLEEIQN